MTIPHMQNCPHQGDGWCLDCVGILHAEVERLQDVLQEIEQVGHNPADLASDLIGKPDRWEELSLRLASMAHTALKVGKGQ